MERKLKNFWVVSLTMVSFSSTALAGGVWDDIVRKMFNKAKVLNLTAGREATPALKFTPKVLSFKGVVEIPSTVYLTSGSGVVNATSGQIVIDNQVVCNYSPRSNSVLFNKVYYLQNCSDGSRSGDDVTVNTKIELRLNYASSDRASLLANVRVIRADEVQYGLAFPYLSATEGQILVYNGEAWVAADPSQLDLEGLQGDQGETGPQGPAGAPGPQGPTGPAGANGLAGAKGDKGEKGDAGAAGPAGVAGPMGPKGADGTPGVAGTAGAVGAVGPQGPAGPAGAAGAIGPQGPAGVAGAIGPKGADGAPGVAGTAGAVGAVGPQGPAGPVGATGSIGPQGPAGVAGAIGPMGPKGSDGAPGVAGATGAAGAVGPQGPAGAIGPAGAQGVAGPIGPQGPKGDTGATGSRGADGAQGPVGPMGSMGPMGMTGAQGAQGLPGAAGAQGPAGANGSKGDKGDKGDRGLSEIAYMRDERASGTQGGTCTAGAWNTRTLNTLGGDTNFIALANNRFLLQPGTYFIEIVAPAHGVNQHQAKLKVIETNTDVMYGTNVSSASNAATTALSVIMGEIIVSDASTFEIQHRCATTKADSGFGASASFGTPEIYTQVKIIKKQ